MVATELEALEFALAVADLKVAELMSRVKWLTANEEWAEAHALALELPDAMERWMRAGSDLAKAQFAAIEKARAELRSLHG